MAVVPRAASAQEPTFAPQPLKPFAAIPPLASPFPSLLGEPTGGASALPGYFASGPLRLSLQSGIVPMAGGFPQCQTLEEASGNSVRGIPVLRYTLLRLTPNLVLHGFSSGGCPIDGGIGAAITYSVPVAPTLWLVAGAGMYGVPSHYPLPARTQQDVRVDLIKQVDAGHSLSVGVGRRGVAFGGVF